jgi:hypothetical protein
MLRRKDRSFRGAPLARFRVSQLIANPVDWYDQRCRTAELRFDESGACRSGTAEAALDNDRLIINGQLRSFSYYRGHAALQEAFGVPLRIEAQCQ